MPLSTPQSNPNLSIIQKFSEKTNAKKICPVFPGAKKMIHKAFPDPSAFQGTKEERLTMFREVRD